MPSRPRSRKSSRSSARNSFKSASILENGGQAPLQDVPNAVVLDDIELVPRISQSIPDADVGASVPFAPSSGVPPTSTMDDHMESRNEPTSTGTRIDPTVSGQRDRLPHKRFGLHTDQLRGYRPQGGLPMDYKQKYPEDPIYKETEENARVFHVYNDESQIFDDDMVIEAGDNLDILLVFAGLFASVLTTFVVQTSQSLSPDKTDISNALLREMISLQRAQENRTSFSSIPAADTTFIVSRTDIWVNSLWFVSLALSLCAALLAVVAKQWLRQYSSFISGTARERALIRQFRYDGLEKWRVRLIIGLLPTILHVSLFLFLAGLVVFLLPLNNTLARVVAGIAGFLCGAYTVTNILPAIFIESHTKVAHRDVILRNTVWLPSPIIVYRWKGSTHLWPKSLKESERARANEGDKWGRPRGIARTLIWLAETTSDISAIAITAEAVGSVCHFLITSDLASVHNALYLQWMNISPYIHNGELSVAENGRSVERLMRGDLMARVRRLDGKPVHCHTHIMMLTIAVYNRQSRLHMKDVGWQSLSPAEVFSFVSGWKDLSAELEAPTWMWWSSFTLATGVYLDFRKQIADICRDGSTPHIDLHRKEWLKEVNIPSTLRRAVRERMLHVYRDEKGSEAATKPYPLSQFSEIFVKRSPSPPFSIVSLATFLYDNFAQFTDFWMETGDVHSHIQNSVTTNTPL